MNHTWLRSVMGSDRSRAVGRRGSFSSSDSRPCLAWSGLLSFEARFPISHLTRYLAPPFEDSILPARSSIIKSILRTHPVRFSPLRLQAICFVTDGSHVAAASLAWREALQHAFSSGDDASDEEHLKFRYRPGLLLSECSSMREGKRPHATVTRVSASNSLINFNNLMLMSELTK